LKPYRFVEDQTLQPIIAKSNDLLPKESIEIKDFGNMFVKELVVTTIPRNMFTK
jgi:hypothetical protein